MSYCRVPTLRLRLHLTPGEVDKIVARVTDYTLNRAWENWARRAGREMQPQPA